MTFRLWHVLCFQHADWNMLTCWHSLFPWLNLGLKSALSSKKKKNLNPNKTPTIQIPLAYLREINWYCPEHQGEKQGITLQKLRSSFASRLQAHFEFSIVQRYLFFLDSCRVASIICGSWGLQRCISEWFLAFAWFARAILSGAGIHPHFILCSAQLLCFLAAGGFLIFSPHSSSFLKSWNFQVFFSIFLPILSQTM